MAAFRMGQIVPNRMRYPLQQYYPYYLSCSFFMSPFSSLFIIDVVSVEGVIEGCDDIRILFYSNNKIYVSKVPFKILQFSYSRHERV